MKVLPRSRVIHQRFEREARAAARLQHPAIVTLYEAAVDDEGAYLVSELVRGRTFDQMLASGKLSDREILEIGVNLCEALDHAHAEGVIHRDVKPSNILVSNRSSNVAGRAKLTDFGVAHVVGGDSLTRTGDVIGTLAYMAPEQAEGREVTPSSDLYSLALVIYEALTGVNPLQGVHRPGARSRRLGAFVPPIRRQRRDLPRSLAAGIDAALRPRASERGTLPDLRAALLSSLEAADDTRGVVAGWRGHEDTEVDDEPGAEWRERRDRDGTPLLQFDDSATQVAGRVRSRSLIRPDLGAPDWLPRALCALGAGLTASWLSVHLLTHSALAPAAVGLLACALTLLLPRLGWAAIVAALAILASVEGRTGGAALWLLVSRSPDDPPGPAGMAGRPLASLPPSGLVGLAAHSPRSLPRRARAGGSGP